MLLTLLIDNKTLSLRDAIAMLRTFKMTAHLPVAKKIS